MIRTINKILILQFFLFFTISCKSDHTQNGCIKFQEIIKDYHIQLNLIEWVDHNFNEKTILTRDDITRINSISPGTFSYKKTYFDVSLLDFEAKRSKIQLIGLNSRDFYPSKNIDIESINSIFFAERSGHGFLVKLKHSNMFIEVDELKYTKEISNRIAIYCKESRDSESYGK